MEKFEYQTRLFCVAPDFQDSLTEVLNALGREGWELVAVTPTGTTSPMWVFKRPFEQSCHRCGATDDILTRDGVTTCDGCFYGQEGAGRVGAARKRLEARQAQAVAVAHLLARQESGEALKTIDFPAYWEQVLPEGKRDEYIARARELISLVELSLKHN
jgi:hypothetical protein